MTKMTKKTAFTMAQDALTTIDTEEARLAWDVIQKELDRMERAALKAKTYESKADKERAEFRQRVLEVVLDTAEALKAADVAELVGESIQKTTAALTRLVADGALTKDVGEKRVVLYRAAE